LALAFLKIAHSSGRLAVRSDIGAAGIVRGLACFLVQLVETSFIISRRYRMNSLQIGEIEKAVRDVIVEVLRVDENTIQRSSRIKEDMGADSLDRAMLLMRLEDAFGESISDEEALEIMTVGDAIQFIYQKKHEVENVL
jgi:acyl carrier protein